ncbi:MAG TPA: glycosyltransferase family 2 protein [Pseudogracilibacillus sp.]|nr:glycosyltransferase family 2 protein [Pseudogracilibacillus sp.]
MLISIVIPAYNEEKNISEIISEIKQAFDTNLEESNTYEILFIDDGSEDNTAQVLEEASLTDPLISYISFSRNFGKEAAMLAGLRNASGDVVIIMDADLQHPPSIMLQMLKEYEKGYEQVIAKRNRKGENATRKVLTTLYYKVINKVIDVELVDGEGDFRLLSRKTVDAILELNEYNRFSKGLYSWVGFSKKVIEYDNQVRESGKSKWSFKSLLNYGIDGVLSFNNKPLRLSILLGFSSIALSLLYLIFLFVQIVIQGIETPGYFTTIAIILFFGGIQLIFLGVIGEYIGRIYYETKERPHYIVKSKKINHPKE